MGSILTFDDVQLYYDHVYALKGVSIDVGEGETVALIGANGAGKSSILRAITGLRKIRSGGITYQGARIDGKNPAEIVRMGIAMVPEGRRVFPHMSVKDNLMMGAFTRTDKAGIADTLDSVLTRFPRLKERYSQVSGTLSGGEQQMLAMARALMGRPKLIVMDEPTMGLSPLFVDRVLALIETINREGVTIFMVEQNASLALGIAHYGYVLQTGQIALEGPAGALLRDPRIRDAYLGGATAA